MSNTRVKMIDVWNDDIKTVCALGKVILEDEQEIDIEVDLLFSALEKLDLLTLSPTYKDIHMDFVKQRFRLLYTKLTDIIHFSLPSEKDIGNFEPRDIDHMSRSLDVNVVVRVKRIDSNFCEMMIKLRKQRDLYFQFDIEENLDLRTGNTEELEKMSDEELVNLALKYKTNV